MSFVLFKAIEFSDADFSILKGEKSSAKNTQDRFFEKALKQNIEKPLQADILNQSELYNSIKQDSNKWIELACSLAFESVMQSGGPFGAVIVQVDSKTSKPIRYWQAINQVTKNIDPTAHAEVMGIRCVCKELGVVNLGEIKKEESKLDQPSELSHCIIYSSCEPCPMCYSAILWARINKLSFAATRYDASVDGVNFSDEAIYKDIVLPYSKRDIEVCQRAAPNALDAFNLWKNIEKEEY